MSTRRGRALACLAVLVAAIAVAQPDGRDVAHGQPPTPPGARASTIALQRLRIAPRGSYAGYSRARFGDGWAPAGEGCDTRDLVLQRDGRDVHTAAACRISGTWTSPYDGRVVRVARELDIDHVVPLAHAWRTGAQPWSARRREAFANDLRAPELVAVTAHTNRAKRDGAPDEWTPPRRAAWCLYARWWIDVKTTWRLTVTGVERRALRAMLQRC
jgi:hypothetical protein